TSDRFNNVLFQREVLGTNPILAGSSFKEVQLASIPDQRAPDGLRDTVSFTLEKMVDTSLIGYTPRSAARTNELEIIEDAPEVEVEDTSSTASDIPSTAGTNPQSETQ